MSRLLDIYHRLPQPARNLAASLRGYYLRSWRYSDQTDAMVEEALARDYWTAQQWQTYQENRLGYLLNRAATQVPYYRQQWEARRRNGDNASWEYLENWPILEKDILRENSTIFVADDCDIDKMFHEHTSGTTAKSLDLWWSKQMVQEWYAIFEARWRRWYGVSRYDRWAILGGQLITPIDERKPPFWVWNMAMNQLYMSSYHLAPDLIPHYLAALKQYKITFMLGYTSSLYALAQEIIRSGRKDVKMTVVIANAEPVFDYQREVIEEAFQCPLRETYGMSEAVAAASECEAGRLHLWPEIGILEIMDGQTPVPGGTPGSLVCTGLLNADMPLIRYRVGDSGSIPAEPVNCECGRTLPVLAGIEGRNDDILYTRDGRRVGRLDTAFKSRLPILEAQVIQETLDRVRVKYVPAPEFKTGDEESIGDRLRERMGDIEVVYEALDEIPRTSNGKFRAVICNLSPEERQQVQ